MKPDYRNIERGQEWLRAMIEASERQDGGDNLAMRKLLAELAQRREKGSGDD